MTASGIPGIRIDNPFHVIHNPSLDHTTYKHTHHNPTYVHQDISIEFMNEMKGRGVIATQNIAANTIIIEDPALLFENNRNDKMQRIVALDIDSDGVGSNHVVYSRVLHNLRFEIAQMLSLGDATDAHKLSVLYDDSVDLDVLRRSKDIDLFRNDVTTRSSIRALNASQISSIINCNCFQIPNGTAVFVLSSMFNHSKENNVLREYAWVNACPVSIFKARRDIVKGEELTVDYGYDPASRNKKKW